MVNEQLNEFKGKRKATTLDNGCEQSTLVNESPMMIDDELAQLDAMLLDEKVDEEQVNEMIREMLIKAQHDVLICMRFEKTCKDEETKAKIKAKRKVLLDEQVELERQLNCLIKYTKQEKVIVPANIPPLIFVNDTYYKTDAMRFETVDRFIEMFEMVIKKQHHLDIDKNWESCFITAIQHNNERTTWYQQILQDQVTGWNEAKEIIMKRFDGGKSQEYYRRLLYENGGFSQ